MRFSDPTLYGRDDETDEYSDSGAYGESLEEDLEEEEEEEEEPTVVGEEDEEDDESSEPAAREHVKAPTPPPSGGGSGAPPKKKAPAKKAPPKKAPAKKAPAKKKAAKKAAKKPAAKKKSKPAKKAVKKPPRKLRKKQRVKKAVAKNLLFPRRGFPRRGKFILYFSPATSKFSLSLLHYFFVSLLIIASASISKSISGETSAVTAIIEHTGRMSRKNSPCAFPTFSQSAIFVRNILVRTTSFNVAPAFSNACRTFFRI